MKTDISHKSTRREFLAVAASPLGSYREAQGGPPVARFGYRFAIENVGKPHVAVIRYPDDKRYICIGDGTSDGFWWDSQLRITPGFQAGSHFLKPYAFSVAELDACRITRGGLFLDKAHGGQIRARHGRDGEPDPSRLGSRVPGMAAPGADKLHGAKEPGNRRVIQCAPPPMKRFFPRVLSSKPR